MGAVANPEQKPAVEGPARFFRLPENRYRGPGQPLVRESWLYRPYNAGPFFGYLHGSPLIDDWTFQSSGVLGGFRLGWDLHYYWGAEMRFAWGETEIYDSDRAIEARNAADNARGIPADDPSRHLFDGIRSNKMFFWDLDVLYYPWGDSAWRPYVLVGMGLGSVRFMERMGIEYDNAFFSAPVGVGLKVWCTDFIALRLECTDNMVFGGEQSIEMLNNLSLTGAVEFRFGGPRRAYWPWSPGRRYW